MDQIKLSKHLKEKEKCPHDGFELVNFDGLVHLED